MRFVLLTDESFANAEGLKSQLGYVLIMVDDSEKWKILHYDSNKCRRIARSVMAAKIQALVLGFEHAFLIKDLAEEVIGKKMDLEAMIDSSTVFYVVAKDGATTERRLQIDVFALWQSYDNGQLSKIA